MFSSSRSKAEEKADRQAEGKGKGKKTLRWKERPDGSVHVDVRLFVVERLGAPVSASAVKRGLPGAKPPTGPGGDMDLHAWKAHDRSNDRRQAS